MPSFDVFKNFPSVVRHVATKNVLSPSLTLAAIVTPASVISAAFGATETAMYLFVLAALPVVSTVGLNIYFAISNPLRLHDEKTQLEFHRLQVLGDSKVHEQAVIEATPVPNPALLDMPKQVEDQRGPQ